jgi:hypothetical protein
MSFSKNKYLKIWCVTSSGPPYPTAPPVSVFDAKDPIQKIPAKDPLTSKNGPPILPTIESNTHKKISNKAKPCPENSQHHV